MASTRRWTSLALSGLWTSQTCSTEDMKQIPIQAATLASLGMSSASLVGRCNGRTLNQLDVFGAQVLHVKANPVYDSTATNVKLNGRIVDGSQSNLEYCNVTVTYTHPGRDDELNVYVVLPFKNWNGRFQGAGGGGWITGVPPDQLAPNIRDGWAIGSTDGGHTQDFVSAADWVLNSPGNVDYNALTNFASRALNDLSIIGKQITTSFYQKPPRKSYWNGCSTGGRQGLMLAQRYPNAFDGIVATAPAINWARFLTAMYWPQQVMNELDSYPPACEIDAIAAEAVDACDEDDGLKDGIISLPGQCHFDASTLVGKTFECHGTPRTFSEEGAKIVNAAWEGPRDPKGLYSWYGLNRGTNLSVGLVGTENCNISPVPSISPCTGAYGYEHITLLVLKDAQANIRNLTRSEYFDIMHRSINEYTSTLSTVDPDLRPFRDNGGKMVTWHGLSDQLIFPNGSSHYYQSVLDIDPQAKDYYRYFEAPGVEHCAGGKGYVPSEVLDAVVKWVEEGVAPDVLVAKSQNGDESERNVCLWPKSQVYIGGDSTNRESFVCE